MLAEDLACPLHRYSGRRSPRSISSPPGTASRSKMQIWGGASERAWTWALGALLVATDRRNMCGGVRDANAAGCSANAK
jgi:hypothetical protein